MMDMIDRMKRWARLAPPSKGNLPNGKVGDAFGLGADGIAVLLMFDSNGRVFQINGATISNGMIAHVSDGRSATLALLDTLDVQDGPVWTGIDR